jgi:hypothetical protein
MFDAYIGSTTTGVFRLRDATLEPLGLESEHVSAIHASRDRDAVTVLAGTYGNGLSAAPTAAGHGRRSRRG